MAIKITMLVVFFGIMIGVGLYCRKNATDVNGFVLGGRNLMLDLKLMNKYVLMVQELELLLLL